MRRSPKNLYYDVANEYEPKNIPIHSFISGIFPFSFSEPKSDRRAINIGQNSNCFKFRKYHQQSNELQPECVSNFFFLIEWMIFRLILVTCIQLSMKHQRNNSVKQTSQIRTLFKILTLGKTPSRGFVLNLAMAARGRNVL